MPFGSVVVVIVTPVAIVIDKACGGEVLPVVSRVVTLKVEVPALVGVPLISPPAAPRVVPGGNAPTDTAQLL